MNTSALKRFAQQARMMLKSGVEQRMLYWGFDGKDETGVDEPRPVAGGCLFRGKILNDDTIFSKWIAMKEAIRTTGASQIAEEAAYTWFNRLMAIRIMEKNEYITPLLDDESERLLTPQIVTHAKCGLMPLAMTGAQRSRIENLLEDDNLETELFASLITIYCQNHPLLRRVFGRLDDWTELLLPADILADNGFIRLLNTTDSITDDDYRKVELIGWLYQFYISEKKEEVFKGFKNNKKAEAKDIPAATQIFTPNWIVKYMVQNTVGRLWLDLHPDSPLRDAMAYLVDNPSTDVETPLINEAVDIKLLDPACGSGHILVEGFNLLFAMYLEEGYSKREAIRQIFTHNLYGLDIDLRAVQLANFALLMKASQHDRQTLESELTPQIYAMPEPFQFDSMTLSLFLGDNQSYLPLLTEILALMQQAQNLGSIMKINIPPAMHEHLQSQLTRWEKQKTQDVFLNDTLERLKPYISIILLITKLYESVAANPPYMGKGNMNETLNRYVSTHYPEGKSDLFTVFMQLALNLCVEKGRIGMINMHSWMFLSSFESLRKKILANYYIENMLHLGPRTFDELSGEVVQNTTFVLQNTRHIGTGIYYRLVDGNNCIAKEQMFIQKENRYSNIFQSNFQKISGSPVAYWVSDRVVDIFNNATPLIKFAKGVKGLDTGDDSYFLKMWWEPLYSEKNWAIYSKGGAFRKWYGNKEFLIKWHNNGYEVKNFKDDKKKPRSRVQNSELYFRRGIEWSRVSSTNFGARVIDNSIFGGASQVAFLKNEENLLYLIALLNTKITQNILKILNPTLIFQAGDINRVPVYFSFDFKDQINLMVQQNIAISKLDWDSQETSCDFEENEIIRQQAMTVEEAYKSWKSHWTRRFKQLHANEVELNRLFIDIYGLQDELTPEVKLKDVTILQPEMDFTTLGEVTEMELLPNPGVLPVKQAEVIGQLISYLIGCLMGRYRLDKPGLHIAHPNPEQEEIALYEYNGQSFQMDKDAIIPLMEATCGFPDNALNGIKRCIEQIWGENTLTTNLNFIEAALGKDLETYLMKDFWKEHCRRYQKRPIYWLFSSPGGAFRALTYMHRMNRFTVEKIRSNYLLKYIQHLENQCIVLEADAATLDRQRQRTLEKNRKDITECRAYDLRLKNVADHQIDFDLDDGVALNYAKFNPVVAAIK